MTESYPLQSTMSSISFNVTNTSLATSEVVLNKPAIEIPKSMEKKSMLGLYSKFSDKKMTFSNETKENFNQDFYKLEVIEDKSQLCTKIVDSLISKSFANEQNEQGRNNKGRQFQDLETLLEATESIISDSHDIIKTTDHGLYGEEGLSAMIKSNYTLNGDALNAPIK